LAPYLERTTESIEQDGKEEQSASAVKAACIKRQVVEDTSDNQGHDEIPN
jgi:hypothetical protein